MVWRMSAQESDMRGLTSPLPLEHASQLLPQIAAYRTQLEAVQQELPLAETTAIETVNRTVSGVQADLRAAEQRLSVGLSLQQAEPSPVEQQAQHKGSSRQQRRVPEQQQVQATEQLLQPHQHQPAQLDGQQASFDGQQVPDERQHMQPRGQGEQGRPIRQTEKARGQKKQQSPNQQQQSDVLPHEGAVESSRVQGGLGRGKNKMRGLECERAMRWGHDKFEETQNAMRGTAKADFPLAKSGPFESPETEIESPQCVEESVSETPLTEAAARIASMSPDAEAESAAELSKHTPAASDQAAISYPHEAPEAVKSSPHAPLHVPSLDDLHVKEGQRPRTTIAIASSTLISCLGLKEDAKHKAKRQEARKELQVYRGLKKAAKAQEAPVSPLTTPATPHVPHSSSSEACRGRGSNMFSGDGSRDYCGILAAKSQRSQGQAHVDLAASEGDPPSSALQPEDRYVHQLQQQQQPPHYQNLALADGGSASSGRQPGNEDMQPQLISTLIEQPEHEGSSRQQMWLPGEQQVQATEQLLHPNKHQPVQLGGQQALVDGQQVPDERQHLQPEGQGEEGRPSRQTEKSAGQKKNSKKKRQGHSQQGDVLQRQGAVADGRVQGGLGRGRGNMRGLECERVTRWGHDKFEETQVASTG
ncbi:TPA: hypothetical protein ACH3X2_008917 [Trebouxia sp. C0005]